MWQFHSIINIPCSWDTILCMWCWSLFQDGPQHCLHIPRRKRRAAGKKAVGPCSARSWLLLTQHWPKPCHGATFSCWGAQKLSWAHTGPPNNIREVLERRRERTSEMQVTVSATQVPRALGVFPCTPPPPGDPSVAPALPSRLHVSRPSHHREWWC